MGARMDHNVSYFGNIERRPGSGPPDLTGGACMNPAGIKAMDAYTNSFGGKNGEGVPHARVVAQQLCFKCPVRQRCRNDTLETEKPPGAWGGMYGAMTPKERRRLKPIYDSLKRGNALHELDAVQFNQPPIRGRDRDGAG
jgi:hypothetical protein